MSDTKQLEYKPPEREGKYSKLDENGNIILLNDGCYWNKECLKCNLPECHYVIRDRE